MIFTAEERRALLALIALLLLGQGFSLWEEYRRARPDRELTAWLEGVRAARGDSLAAAGLETSADGDSSAASEPGSDPAGRSEGGIEVLPSTAVPPGVLESGKIRINEARAPDLEALPGIGPALAQRIVREREASGPFRRPEDLLRVPGIGPKKLERMRDRIDCGK